jgi:hypothetical protein
MKRALIIAAVLVVALYVGDDLWVRYRMWSHGDPFGTVKIERYYAVRQKSHKEEFYFLDPEMRPCVHSLFPQLGYSPCWYLNRKRQQRIEM